MLKLDMVSKGKMYISGQDLKWVYSSPKAYSMTVRDAGQTVEIWQDGKTKKVQGEMELLYKNIAQIVIGSATGSSLSKSSDFYVEMYTEGKTWVAKMIPRQSKMQKMFTCIYLYFNDSLNAAYKVVMQESNGDTTTITFSNMKLNEKVTI